MRERHDRSYRARRRVGEEVTRVQDARDVLRVSTHYEQRRLGAPPYPAWLAVPAAPVLEERAGRLAHPGDRILADAPWPPGRPVEVGWRYRLTRAGARSP